MRDPYRILGVSPEADVEEIKAAYRKAALRLHPDTYAGDPADGARLFREVTEAYEEVLEASIAGHPETPQAEEPQRAKGKTPAEIARGEHGYGGPRAWGWRRAGPRRTSSSTTTGERLGCVVVLGILFMVCLLLVIAGTIDFLSWSPSLNPAESKERPIGCFVCLGVLMAGGLAFLLFCKIWDMILNCLSQDAGRALPDAEDRGLWGVFYPGVSGSTRRASRSARNSWGTSPMVQ